MYLATKMSVLASPSNSSREDERMRDISGHDRWEMGKLVEKYLSAVKLRTWM